jgi:hypothetical protein
MLEINKRILRPDPAAELLPGYCGAGCFQQGGEDLERLSL